MQVSTPQPSARTRPRRRASARALHGVTTSYASTGGGDRPTPVYRKTAALHSLALSPGHHLWPLFADRSPHVLPRLRCDCGPVATALFGVRVGEARVRVDLRENVLA